MANYLLSGKADEDLISIYLFTLEEFGETQADAYLYALEERFEILAENPALGRGIAHIREGYRRYEHVSHSIFYRATDGGVLIMRVLHSSMDTDQHL